MQDIQYKIIYTGRKTISIIVSPVSGVTVRAPYRTTLKSISRFVREKSGWITRQLINHSTIKRINHGKEYKENEPHLFLGVENRLRIRSSTRRYVKQYDNIIELGTSGTGDVSEIKTLLDKWYLEEAGKRFVIIMDELLIRFRGYGFFPSGIVVRRLKSRWGSCSSGGRITISSELVKLEPRFAEYVIIHELCHLRHHNHGESYYRLLSELVPDFRSIRRELRNFITK